ncbi:WYL domain-containing protein [Streptomyces acidicola]|uniref:hypothetical protein n=1 Tax=Streptomyces acidicola TaxID=2596892 RepID=UPI0038056190
MSGRLGEELAYVAVDEPQLLSPTQFQATVTLHESAEAVADRVWPGMGVVEPLDDHGCLLHLGADTPRDLA